MTTEVSDLLASGLPLRGETVGVHADRVEVPVYDRRTLVPSIVHIGVGGFHRAHQLLYFDELAQRQLSSDWGVVGVSLHSRGLRDALQEQDFLFTVVQRGSDGQRGRVVGVMGDYLYAPDAPDALIERLSDETTRLVTLTITGTAYPVDSETGSFQQDDPEVTSYLQDPERPEGVFGYLVEALARRRALGRRPFTVLSCDNMQHNGGATRTAVVSLARLRDEDLARWIEETVAFPSSMVDRITPETTPEERDRIVAEFGVGDQRPVLTETFSQWIVEDDFCNGRPPLDQVGVQFVDDVRPYELMKTRLLNAGHSAMGYVGYLCGYRSTSEVMDDPVLRDYVARFLAEVAPLVPEVPGIDLEDYQRTLLERFANPSISDQLTRLCRRGSTKMANYLLPSVREAIERGHPTPMLALAVAAWFRYLRGVDEAGQPIEVQDPQSDVLVPLARQGGADPGPLLQGVPALSSLAADDRFLAALRLALACIEAKGVHETVRSWPLVVEPQEAA